MTFEECLKRGRIKEFSQGKALVQKELQTAEHDLSDGKEGFERKKYKWTILWGQLPLSSFSTSHFPFVFSFLIYHFSPLLSKKVLSKVFT